MTLVNYLRSAREALTLHRWDLNIYLSIRCVYRSYARNAWYMERAHKLGIMMSTLLFRYNADIMNLYIDYISCDYMFYVCNRLCMCTLIPGFWCLFSSVTHTHPLFSTTPRLSINYTICYFHIFPRYFLTMHFYSLKDIPLPCYYNSCLRWHFFPVIRRY